MHVEFFNFYLKIISYIPIVGSDLLQYYKLIYWILTFSEIIIIISQNHRISMERRNFVI